MILARGSGFGVVGVVCLGVTLWVGAVVMAEEAPQSRSRKAASGWATKGTEKTVSLDTLEEKLKRILANQQTILQQADAVKQELGVIKVRASTPARSVTFLSTGQACP